MESQEPAPFLPISSAGFAVCVLGFPTDCNSSYLRGPAKAPGAIRKALWNEGTNSFTESGLDLRADGVLTDGGDLSLRDDPSDVQAITHSITAQLIHSKRVMSLGGDHSITYPIVRAYAQRFAGLSIVQFDAHPDLYPVFAGNRLSHACPFARILEDAGIAGLTQVGIRTMTPPQREVADRYHVRVFGASGQEEAIRALTRGPVYVSVDLDGLDPAFAPGVSHREPGGLSVREVLSLIGAIPGTIVGADVVELNPDEDVRDMTATVAAKIVKELISRMYADRPSAVRT
ncbi:MAG: agmatinase [Candidatus Eremiobacteraeota bacterium]|nr:agmatinase [Candidatus Eremiobacteraeota bacterium]